jgi:hypothetical protein
MCPQGGVVSISEGMTGLAEHRGAHDSCDSWQGLENRDVTVLALLPRRFLRSTELLEQVIEGARYLSTSGGDEL